jgi:putative transposase
MCRSLDMPRQPRLVLPDVALHIVQRGNNRCACFLIDSDYQIYLLHLRKLAGKLGCRVHAYCLMTNHVHLLLTPPSAEACMALMRDLGQRYVQYFNKRHDRSGTLWEGRFRSCVTESARYVLACYRYIEMNPIRARMVAQPADYRWSSHGCNTGVRADPLVCPHPEFLAMAQTDAARQEAYRALFGHEIDAATIRAIRESTNGGYPLGGESLKGAASHISARRLERGKAGRPTKAVASEDDDGQLEIGL